MLLTSPFIITAKSTRHLMWQVILALLPGMTVLLFWQGTRWLWQLALAIIAAVIFEAAMLKVRKKRRWRYHVSDGSAILTALLLTLSVPVILPSWLLILGIGFALVFGKHLYGGLGMNLFNPAMLGYAFLLVSFPVAMSVYPDYPQNIELLWQSVDSISGATILDSTRALRIDGHSIANAASLPWQKICLNASWLLGGCYLLYRRYVDWRIVVSVLLGIVATAAIFCLIDADRYLGSYTHLMAGASIFGAFFIATDPVTAATTPLGRWLYGLLVGLLTVCIRNLGNFPDGFAFAVLLANAFVVIIDPLTQPRYR